MKKYERVFADIVKLLKDRKAETLVKLDFSGSSFYTENFLIATAQSSSHLSALHAELRRLSKTKKFLIYSESMEWSSGWVIMDLGRTIVHLFLKDARENYDLENLWGDIPRMDL